MVRNLAGLTVFTRLFNSGTNYWSDFVTQESRFYSAYWIYGKTVLANQKNDFILYV